MLPCEESQQLKIKASVIIELHRKNVVRANGRKASKVNHDFVEI